MICSANQLTGFYMRALLAFNQLGMEVYGNNLYENIMKNQSNWNEKKSKCCNKLFSITLARKIILSKLEVAPPPQRFFKYSVLKYFAKLSGKHLCQSPFLVKPAAYGFYCKCWEILPNDSSAEQHRASEVSNAL